MKKKKATAYINSAQKQCGFSPSALILKELFITKLDLITVSTEAAKLLNNHH